MVDVFFLITSTLSFRSAFSIDSADHTFPARLDLRGPAGLYLGELKPSNCRWHVTEGAPCP